MAINRRVLSKIAASRCSASARSPHFFNARLLPRHAAKKKLVVLFQRGAADGLNIVVPFGEPNYYRMRPTIAIPAPHARRRSSRD